MGHGVQAYSTRMVTSSVAVLLQVNKEVSKANPQHRFLTTEHPTIGTTSQHVCQARPFSTYTITHLHYWLITSCIPYTNTLQISLYVQNDKTIKRKTSPELTKSVRLCTKLWKQL